MSKSRQVALLIDTSTSWGIRLIKGINQFAHESGDWLIHVEPRGRYEQLHVPAGWTGDGILARINRKALADEIVASGLPAVNVSWYPFAGARIARCTVDERQTGRMAAEYFLTNGFQQFAYCGPLDRPGYVDQLSEAYGHDIEAAGFRCEQYQPPAGTDQRTIAWNVHLAHLVKWLKGLPKPIALLAWSAARGRQVTEACHYAGLGVPDDVAVLGGEYDDLMSNISYPPLSTIDQPAEQVGYAAAELLARMMAGRKPPAQPVLFPPSRIDIRHSTDTLAIDDPLVRDALTLIRHQAPHGIYVSDVVRKLSIARRTLEQRFVRLIGRTPAAEIRRVRIEEAKRLLIESDRSIAEVARATGFGQQDLFSRTFRRSVGMPPSEYRRQHHSGGWLKKDDQRT
jgi:LacI family transcriptional regulator